MMCLGLCSGIVGSLEAHFDAKGPQIYFCLLVLLLDKRLPLFVVLQPVNMFKVQMILHHEELNKRMHQQVDRPPSLVWVFYQTIS